jgi:hypothetical protein
MEKEAKDLRVLALFTSVYCTDHHSTRESVAIDLGLPKTSKYRFCPDCADFLRYAIARRRHCPLKPKPTCKHCEVHCYRPGHRERVREIMRYSGKTLILRGRFDLLWHYFF